MVALDFDNSRMKDFYDVWTCAKHLEFDGETLARSIAATFARRDTALPRESPLALTRAFSEADIHQIQWNAFVRKIGEPELAGKFADMVAEIDRFLMPPTVSAAQGSVFGKRRAPMGSWIDQ